MTHDEKVLQRAKSLLSERDMKVAQIGWEFYLDGDEGYGHCYDGQEANINNAFTYLLGRLIGKPEYGPKDETGYHSWYPPDGLVKQDVHSDEFWSGKNYPKGWTYDQLVAIGVSLDDIPEDKYYQGLNIDEDCAVSELLCAVSMAYSWYADDYDWEDLKEKYVKKYQELGLDIKSCSARAKELTELSMQELGGKHDRNEHMWC